MKINKKGFTLIELLAVITIMGILLLVAIPAVSRTIENSRRDTFANTAKEYINAVRNGVLADNISCYDSTNTWRTASANPGGTYYFPICTSSSVCAQAGQMTTANIQQSTKDLMEQGGLSPFGKAEMRGYVKFVKTVDATTGKTTTVYSIVLIDSGYHGISTETDDTNVSRSSVNVSLAASNMKNAPGSGYVCKLN